MPTRSEPSENLRRLEDLFASLRSFVIAVSGGIDSTLLAIIAGRSGDVEMEVFHAVSPAVPKRATERVRTYAQLENWNLTVADTGEFQDERYMSNPIDRCYYCKTNLYSSIAGHSKGLILSGTNLDDLSDFRPGLLAAKQRSVRHPYVETNISKLHIRELAKHLRLHDLADLPASPCLSSRVQTGTRINADWLQVIDQVEVEIQHQLKAQTVRCRIRNQVLVIELDEHSYGRIEKFGRTRLSKLVKDQIPFQLDRYPVLFAPYRMGSAFVTDAN